MTTEDTPTKLLAICVRAERDGFAAEIKEAMSGNHLSIIAPEWRAGVWIAPADRRADRNVVRYFVTPLPKRDEDNPPIHVAKAETAEGVWRAIQRCAAETVAARNADLVADMRFHNRIAPQWRERLRMQMYEEGFGRAPLTFILDNLAYDRLEAGHRLILRHRLAEEVSITYTVMLDKITGEVMSVSRVADVPRHMQADDFRAVIFGSKEA